MNIYNSIKRKNVITFDIFDTLIKRNCQNPGDIFAIVEKKYNQIFNPKITDFIQERKKAYYLAREKSTKDEVTISEIYSNLSYSKITNENLKKLEIETEINFCQRNEKMYEIYQYVLKSKKEIFCISDMYLPKKIIKKILDNNGYKIDLEHIYISCEIGLSKKTGKLFDFFLKNNEFKSKDIIHIGDSWKYDYLMPKKYGIKSYHIKRNLENMHHIKFFESKNLADNIVQTIINNNSFKLNDFYQKFGYEILGPFCLVFCQWLNKICLDEKINNILFCSRDMKLIMEIYNEIYKDKAIKNNYFYVSRKSLALPYLYENNNYDDAIKVILPNFNGSRQVTIDEVLKCYNVNVSQIPIEIFEKYNIEVNKKIDGKKLIKDNNFINFYNSYLIKIINDDAKKQNSYFKQYLHELTINQNTLIVDSGWRCTMQKMMVDYWCPKIKGAYIGVKSNYIEINPNNTKAFLFYNEQNDYYDKISAFQILFENIIEASHGSAIKYQSNKPRYILSNAHVENSKEVEKIHTGAKKFIKDLSNYLEYIDGLNKEIYINNLLRVGVKPTKEEAKILGEFMNDNYVLRKFASPNKLLYYFIHPKKFKEDFTNSEWKIGFMKRMLKIDIDYYKLYNFLKKWKGSK